MKVLTLNGGGTSGYMSACFLAELEKEIGPLAVAFDLIAGVSTGSILATAIGMGMPMSQVMTLYEQMIPKIFKRSWLFWKPLYNADKLRDGLLDAFGDTPFTHMKTNVMVHALQISGMIETKFWKSWNKTDEVSMIDVVLASSAAPVYFAPHTIGDIVYIDGGMSINNPSMCALAEAIRLNNGILNDIQIVNVQCGSQYGFSKDRAEKMRSIFQWYNNLVGTILCAGDETAEYQVHQLIGFNNHAITPAESLPLDSQDLGKMRSLASDLWKLHKADLLSRWPSK